MRPITIFLIALGCFAAPGAFAADLLPPAPVPAAPLSAAEVRSIYAGNTWHWEEGAGYFATTGEFRGFTRHPDQRVDIGTGTWSVAQGGVMCFAAEWQFDGATQVERCFGHLRANRTIYQREHPDGEWYVFSHSPPRPGDEITRIRRGDQVTPQLQRLGRR